MANNFTYDVSEGFNVEAVAEQLKETYEGKGYTVRINKLKNGFKLTVEKGVGGINTLLGMGQGITATCNLRGKESDTLSVTLSDGDWMGKIIGFVAGWFLCMVPFVTAIIGTMRQLNLQKDVANEIELAVSDAE